ncbi:hypothetical protein D3C72_2374120 [compost metagenome]
MLDKATQGFDTLDMAFGPPLAAQLGPTSIAVHDNAEVARNLQARARLDFHTGGRFPCH